MSLTIVKTPPKVRRFSTYDLEWVPGSMQLRIAGCYDVGRGYRWYRTIEEFVQRELTSDNDGRWFYAHAGGLADFEFVLEHLVRSGRYQVGASFSGSSAIIVTVQRGGRTWYFLDSYWLLRAPLADVAKWIGRKKGSKVRYKLRSGRTKALEDMDQDERREYYSEVSLSELRDYNAEDCEILWEAIDQFERAILDAGGQLNMTLASTAMGMFRRKFLKHEIDVTATANGPASEAYASSRVEVYEDYAEDAFYYDINSSFPYSMTHPQPGEYLGSSSRLPDGGSCIYVARAKVQVPEAYLAPLPYRHGGRVFFPTGTWTGWYDGVDLELLQEEGGKILKVEEVLRFSPQDDLAAYAKHYYDARKKCEKGSLGDAVNKLLLNALYGKFAEGEEKEQMLVDPPEEALRRMSVRDEYGQPMGRMLSPGIWLERRLVQVEHAHVPISMHVTALSRRLLYRFLSLCERLYYCDTDSVITPEHLPTSGKLGDLKFEQEVVTGEFNAPKVYRTSDADGKVTVKAKGFSLGKKEEALERMQLLLDGEEIPIRRMSRIREMYSKGQTTPSETLIMKRLRERDLTKRFTYPDGSTRPWHVEELKDWSSKAGKMPRIAIDYVDRSEYGLSPEEYRDMKEEELWRTS